MFPEAPDRKLEPHWSEKKLFLVSAVTTWIGKTNLSPDAARENHVSA